MSYVGWWCCCCLLLLLLCTTLLYSAEHLITCLHTTRASYADQYSPAPLHHWLNCPRVLGDLSMLFHTQSNPELFRRRRLDNDDVSSELMDRRCVDFLRH